MSEDVVEQGKSMLGTIEYAKAKGITQAYPDSSVAEVVGNLVAEVERLRSACKTLGETIDSQCQMVLNITGLHDLVDETGDGDWGLIWEKLAELGSGRLM